MQRIAQWTLTFLLCSSALLRAQDAPDQPGLTHPAAPALARERAWWNHDEVVKDLDLTGEQRTKMDELLTVSLQKQRDSQRKQHQAHDKLEAALQQGDLQAARNAAPDLREALGDTWDCKSTLMLDVLSLLSGGQRQKLLAKHPDLLRQPFEDPRRLPGSRANLPLSVPAR